MPLRPYSDPLKPPYRAPERRGQPPMSTFFTLRKHELAASRGPVRCPRTGTGEAYYGSALAKWNYQANPSKLVPRNPQRRRDMLTLAVPANAVVAVNANPWNPERARETMRYLSEQDKTDQCLMHYQDVISTALAQFGLTDPWLVALFNTAQMDFWLPRFATYFLSDGETGIW